MIEPHSSGHHGPYLEWMANGLAEGNFEVTIATTPESMEHPSFRSLVKGNEKIRIVPITGLSHSDAPIRLSSLVTRELAYWRYFKKCHNELSRDMRPDVVFLPYLDYCLYAFGLLGSPFERLPWVGLAMRPSFHYQEMGVVAPRPALAILKKHLFFRMLGNHHLRSLLTIDQPLATYMISHAKLGAKVIFFPEPVRWAELPNKTFARNELCLPPKRNLILVYGAITERKGIKTLLRAMASAEFPESTDVILAGKQSAEIDKLLTEPWISDLIKKQRLILLNRFIEDSEEPTLFSSVDIVWLGYQQHYSSSGVLAQAAAARRPVIACHEGIIGWQTSRYFLGRTVNTTDPAAINLAIKSILDHRDECANDPALNAFSWSTVPEAVYALSKALSNESDIS